MMNSADSCIRNYLCGNLEDAKRQARRVRSLVIYQALRARYGKTEAQAAAIARYLKNPSQFTWDAACKEELATVPNTHEA